MSNRRKAILEVSTLAGAKLTLQLRGKLRQVLEVSKADDPSVVQYLRQIQASLLETLQEALRLEKESNVSDMATISTGEGMAN